MIAYLRGVLANRTPEGVVIDVHGVGYEVLVSFNTYQQLPPTGVEAALDIYTYVREDQLTLFGFGIQGEKRLFLQLITVPGIGPKMGLAILSGISPAELVTAVVAGNTTRLTRISGIGKRLAERIVVDLKDKLKGEVGLTEGAGSKVAARPVVPPDGREELVQALTVLGYRRTEIDHVLTKLPTDGPQTVEVLLRVALRELKPAGV